MPYSKTYRFFHTPPYCLKGSSPPILLSTPIGDASRYAQSCLTSKCLCPALYTMRMVIIHDGCSIEQAPCDRTADILSAAMTIEWDEYVNREKNHPGLGRCQQQSTFRYHQVTDHLKLSTTSEFDAPQSQCLSVLANNDGFCFQSSQNRSSPFSLVCTWSDPVLSTTTFDVVVRWENTTRLLYVTRALPTRTTTQMMRIPEEAASVDEPCSRRRLHHVQCPANAIVMWSCLPKSFQCLRSFVRSTQVSSPT